MDGDRSLLRELNDNPGQFTRIMQILNSKQTDEAESPRQSKVIRISGASAGDMITDGTSERTSLMSEHAKKTKKKNAEELGSFYRKLREGIKEEDSEDGSAGSDATSDLMTEIHDHELVDRAVRVKDDEDEDLPKGSIYQKNSTTDPGNGGLRRALTSNLGNQSGVKNSKNSILGTVEQQDVEESEEE